MQPDFIKFNSTTVAGYQLGEGPPLLILHGWGSSARVMMPIARQLAGLRTCYLIDLPGFGRSAEPPEPWSVDDYADLVDEWLDRCEAEKVDLLVHSYGGRIALKLMARPQSAKKIGKVLITGGAGLKPKRRLSYYLRRAMASLLKAPARLLPGKTGERYLETIRRSSLWKRLGSSDYRKLSGIMRQTFVQSVTDHLDRLLAEIDHEVLLVWGENDEATPLEQGRRMEKGLREGVLVVIDGAGHYAFLDRPKKFASIAASYYRGGEGNGT